MNACRLLLPALAWSASSAAAELRSIEFDRVDDRYVATADIWLDAPRDSVFEVLSDWDDAQRFSSLIVAARNIAADADGRPGFYIQIRGCLLFFCKTFVREGWVVREPDTLLSAIADPARSDFEMSEETWRFEADAGGTLIRYEMQMNPKFWVPPVIGPYAIRRKIEKDGVEALERIEQHVRETMTGDAD